MRTGRATTSAAEAWLARPPAEPWVAMVSLVSPHYPLTAPEEWLSLYDPAEMPMPVGWRAGAPAHPELRNLAAFFDYDRYFDVDGMRAAVAAYFALVSFMDDCVGRVLAALDTSGAAQETDVIYVSDHGEMLGDHGFWTKQVMYEASAGVPMIAAGPGFPVGRRVRTPVSLIDLAPRLAGGSGWVGRDLRRIASAPDETGRTAFSEYHDGGSRTGAFMVRWDDWKYVHYEGARPQIFNLARDPHEMADLSGRADVAEVEAEGARRLAAICDPTVVNARAFADQAARIEALGGAAAVRGKAVFNHTPAPGAGSAL